MNKIDDIEQEITRQQNKIFQQERDYLQLYDEKEMLRLRLERTRDYLMQVKPSELTIEDVLEELGFGRTGLESD